MTKAEKLKEAARKLMALGTDPRLGARIALSQLGEEGTHLLARHLRALAETVPEEAQEEAARILQGLEKE